MSIYTYVYASLAFVCVYKNKGALCVCLTDIACLDLIEIGAGILNLCKMLINVVFLFVL